MVSQLEKLAGERLEKIESIEDDIKERYYE
jgi:hypothetical protein